jgi:hypothetical protein
MYLLDIWDLKINLIQLNCTYLLSRVVLSGPYFFLVERLDALTVNSDHHLGVVDSFSI